MFQMRARSRGPGVIEFVAGKDEVKRLSRPHGVALASDRERCGAGAANVAGDEGEVVDSSDRHSALGRVIDAHGPSDEGGLCTTIEQSGFDDLSLGESGDSRDMLGREGGNELS
jgi:hypothetical protein